MACVCRVCVCSCVLWCVQLLICKQMTTLMGGSMKGTTAPSYLHAPTPSKAHHPLALTGGGPHIRKIHAQHRLSRHLPVVGGHTHKEEARGFRV